MAKKRVLLVDDEPDIREIARTSLELVAGWDVLAAANGSDGIEVARTESPDLILPDVMMPDMDGPTTFATLLADDVTKDIPVIFLTAKVKTREIERLTEMGAIGVIAKPFDPMSLAAQVEQLLNKNAA